MSDKDILKRDFIEAIIAIWTRTDLKLVKEIMLRMRKEAP